jgi:methylase of polypeptide subunit release factors
MSHSTLFALLIAVPAVMTVAAALVLARDGQGSMFKRVFMAFWYRYVRALNLLAPSIRVGGKRLVVFPDVYKPLENEHACIDYCREGDRVLDLGCGSGVSTVFCAGKASQVHAVDISGSAVRNTEENCRLHGLTNVAVAQSDMFSNVEGRFDLILANPPYIALDFKGEQEQFATSVRFLPVLFGEVREHLTPEGRLLVQFPLWFKGRLQRLAADHGLELVSVRRTPLKGPGLFLLSLLYMQVGFRSAFYLFRVRPEPAEAQGLPRAA